MHAIDINSTHLEKALNQLESTDFLESEPIIARCFEVGFFPWDNPKFVRLLLFRIQTLLDPVPEWGRSAVRGGMYARLTIELTVGDPHHGWIAQQVKQLLSEGDDTELWPTVSDFVAAAQRLHDKRVARSLKRAKRRLGLAG
ncbi:MAG: hypothetical protein AAFQ61_02225 [Cyanobacteria bacterium J06626_23]